MNRLARYFRTGARSLILLLCVTTANAEGIYRGKIDFAVTQVAKSLELFKAGDLDGSQAALQPVSSTAQEFKSMLDGYEANANAEQQRCMSKVVSLEKEVGDLYQEEQRLSQDIDKLEAEMAGAGTQMQINQQEVEALNAELGQLQQRLDEHQQKIKEMEAYWWVPGYGLYLGIRTLADDDVGNVRRAADSLRDKREMLDNRARALQDNRSRLVQLQQMQRELAGQREAMNRMRAEAEERIGDHRKIVVFLNESGQFWGKLQSTLGQAVENRRDSLESLYAMLDQQSELPAVAGATAARRAGNLQEVLLQFGGELDAGSQYAGLISGATHYCGN
ncbi:hypothetical protein [Trinickia fusca]|uniref:Uncharacterized protein n=1 Tax=Trinickia fusca TaxID=2419777 RepID=A0A494XCG1_9BURK|nr:hypothetical protein [Trinickia fusca]RKP47602.1 hypothetical protein D7S89_15365 [Trinickia fusca]